MPDSFDGIVARVGSLEQRAEKQEQFNEQQREVNIHLAENALKIEARLAAIDLRIGGVAERLEKFSRGTWALAGAISAAVAASLLT